MMEMSNSQHGVAPRRTFVGTPRPRAVCTEIFHGSTPLPPARWFSLVCLVCRERSAESPRQAIVIKTRVSMSACYCRRWCHFIFVTCDNFVVPSCTASSNLSHHPLHLKVLGSHDGTWHFAVEIWYYICRPYSSCSENLKCYQKVPCQFCRLNLRTNNW